MSVLDPANVPFIALGNKVTKGGLEPIPLPHHKLLREVCFTSDEVTAVCPITEQPDLYKVSIDFEPTDKSIESKSLKLYLQSFRNEGIFCESLANKICADICEVADPKSCNVTVTQKSRGGITLVATATRLPYPA